MRRVLGIGSKNLVGPDDSDTPQSPASLAVEQMKSRSVHMSYDSVPEDNGPASPSGSPSRRLDVSRVVDLIRRLTHD
jgi:hypothetical protein